MPKQRRRAASSGSKDEGDVVFSSDGELCVCTIPDQRLLLFDVATGKLKAQWSDPSSLPLRACFSSVPSAGKGSKKSKNSVKCIAAGGRSGNIALYSLSTGEVQKRLGEKGDAHGGEISALAGCSDFVLASGDDQGQLKIWNTESGEAIHSVQIEKGRVRSIVLDWECKRLLVACTSIRLYEIQQGESGEELAMVTKFVGNVSPPRSLIWQDDVFLCANSDRFLNGWTIGEGTVSTAVFSLDSPPLAVAFDHSKAEDGKKRFVSVSSGGSVAIWESSMVGEAVAEEPSLRVSVQGKARVVSATFRHGELVLVRGELSRPFFQTCTIVDGDGDLVEETLVEDVDPPQSERTSAKENAAHASSVQLTSSASTKRGIQKRTGTEGGKALREQVEELLSTESSAGGTMEAGMPKAASLQAVLVQALQSGDSALLDYCLGVRDHGVIRTTVKKLPQAFVARLLSSLQARLKEKPSRAVRLLHWMKAVMEENTAFLMTSPSATTVLDELYGMVEARMEVLPKLFELEGRLSLVLSQAARKENKNEEKEEEGVVYKEEDESEDEDEDEDEESGEEMTMDDEDDDDDDE